MPKLVFTVKLSEVPVACVNVQVVETHAHVKKNASSLYQGILLFFSKARIFVTNQSFIFWKLDSGFLADLYKANAVSEYPK